MTPLRFLGALIENRKLLVQHACLLLAVALILLFLIWLVHLYATDLLTAIEYPEITDFYKFYLSGERLNQGLSMYWMLPPHLLPGDPCFPGVPAQQELKQIYGLTDCLHPNLNPPFFAVIAWPIAQLGFATSLIIWSLASVVGGLISIIVMTRIFVRVKKIILPYAALAGIIFFAYFPTYINISYGQLTLIMLPLVVFSWSALRDGRELQAGFWLGLAASLKPFFGLFLFTFLIARYWRAAAWCVFTGSVAAALGLLLVGWDDHLDYFHVASDVTWLAVSWNGSFAGYFSRIFGGGENIPWLYAKDLGRLLTTFSSLWILGLVAILLYRVRGWHRSDRVDVLFALTLPAMLMISPLGWLYYFPFLVIGFVVVWRLSAESACKRIWKAILLGVVFVTAIPRALESASSMNSPYSWFFGGAIYHYALLVLMVVTAGVVWQASRRARF